MRPHLSVIICTHNPRKDYLERVLKALQEQTLPSESWELLLIDNASDNLLKKEIDLKWHPQSRHIREEQLGLTPARLRGIKESVSETLVFVDDDNILRKNYLSESLIILKCMPWLGAIGGQILPEYEVPPPDWLLYHERVLAIRRTDRARWSNNSDDWQSQPWGAGMVIRREVCNCYEQNLLKNPLRRYLDRQGNLLISGGDVDLVLTSLELGMGFGVFPELEVIHLIPPTRMTQEYILKISRGHATSRLLLHYLRREPLPKRTEQRSLYTEIRGLYHYLKRSKFSQKMEKAVLTGERDFEDLIEDLKN